MPDDPDLRERVRELEATVEQQSETIQQLMPSRRAVVAGMLGAGAGAAGMYGATDQARASGHSGQVGTSSDPVNVEAHQVNVQNGVDLNSNDLTNVGTANIEEATIKDLGAKIGLSADQTISHDTFTTVAFDTANINGGFNQIGWDTANNKYVADEDELLFISASHAWASDVDGQVRFRPEVNGSPIEAGYFNDDSITALNSNEFATGVKLSANDELDITVRQRHGSDRDLRADATNETGTHVNIWRVGT